MLGAMSIAITEDHRALAAHRVRLPRQAPVPRRRPRPARGRRRAQRVVLQGGRRPRLARPARPRGARRLRLRPRGDRRRRRGARPGPRPRRVRPHADRQRRARRRRHRRRQGPPAARPRRRLDARRRRPRRRRRRAATGRCTGSAGTVLGAGLADVHPRARRRRRRRRRRQGRRRHRRDADEPRHRPAAPGRVTLDGATGDVLPGARRALTDIARTILAAEAVGVARESTDLAAEYAKVRLQFGRPIAMFQAVKHHCANMAVATELATAAVWDAARAAAGGGDQFSYAAAVAAALAVPAADLCANLGMQVHGGIGFTWEHDCHVYLRRATAIARRARRRRRRRRDVVDLTRARRHAATAPSTCRPRPSRSATTSGRSSPRSTGLDDEGQHGRLIESGYAMPHWPKPYGLRRRRRSSSSSSSRSSPRPACKRPQLGITGWVILTMIQHGTAEQVSRWVRPGARPGRHLVPAVQRARRRLRRRRHQDQGHPRRRRLAGQRPEGLDERRQGVVVRPGHDPHQPRRAEAPGHHDDGHRHEGQGRRGAPAEAGDRRLGVQRGLLQRRVRARRRRHRPGRQRLDRRPGHARQRERQHRRRLAAAGRRPTR